MMRATDAKQLSKADEAAIVQRVRIHWSGLAIAVGGVAFALVYPAQATVGFVAAIVGAGLVDPSKVLGLFRK